MKILMTCSSREELGTFIRLLRYGNALNQRGHQVTLIRQGNNRWFPVKEDRDGVTIVKMPRLIGDRFFPKTVRPNDIFFRLMHVRNNTYDIHHAFQEFECVAIPWYYSRRKKRATIHIYDADDLWVDGGYLGIRDKHRGIRRWHYDNAAKIERATRKDADGMTVVSQFLLDRAVDFGADSNNVHFVRPGISIDNNIITPRLLSREKLGIPLDKFVVVFTGYGQQDMSEVINIFGEINQNRESFFFLLIGPDKDCVFEQAKTIGFEKQMIVTGSVKPEEVNFYLSAADVGILPYPDTLMNRSRWPTKLSDYLASGLPVLVGPAGDIGNELVDQEAGATYNKLTDAADILLDWSKNPSKLKKLKAAAQTTAAKIYDIDVQAEMLENFYTRLIDNSFLTEK